MRKGYPFNKTLKNHLWIALGLGLWVFVFLYFSEPFGIDEVPRERKLFTLPVYGLIQSLSYCIPLLYQVAVVKKHPLWSIANEALFIGLTVIIGAIINFAFYKYVVVGNVENAFYFIEYLKLFYLPALTIVLPFVVIGRILLGKLLERITIEDKITIKGKGQYDFINLKSGELLFIQSSDNYMEINFKENETINKKLIRGTLSEVEKAFPELLKTHRSFLINPIHFKQFKLEDKKLFVDLGLGITIPVSRGLQTSVKNELQVATNE